MTVKDFWKDAPVARPRRNKTPEELMQQPQNFRRIKSVMGITGSSRPCLVSTCKGTRVANLHKYHDGSFALVWRCQICHQESEFGVTQAVTREPQNAAEALT